jgi:cytochrome o ubiquinol oxidase operon protein cyoD
MDLAHDVSDDTIFHLEDDHGHADHGVDHGTLRGYLTGFGLSVVLTAIPFWLVMSNALGNQMASAIAIMAFAVVQIVVHMVFFLHMNTRSESGWTMMALIFTLILVVIALTGSLWVMYHLNINMMPGHDMSQMP